MGLPCPAASDLVSIGHYTVCGNIIASMRLARSIKNGISSRLGKHEIGPLLLDGLSI